MLMTQMFPTAEEKVVRSKSQLMGPPASLTPIVLSTFGDDSAVWEHNVLGTEAGDDRYWGMQTQTLLDAHGQEGQLGQVVPKEPPQQLSREQKQRPSNPPTAL